MNTRVVTHKYEDPVDLMWIHCANQLGITVERDDEVFASWDGQGVLRIGRDSLDPDDSLAQMILHELCHALVEGPDSIREADWGLNGPVPKTRVHEFATLRLQACLADQFELRSFFSATTDFHEYYQALPADPLRENVDFTVEFRILRPLTNAEDQQAIEWAARAKVAWTRSSWRLPMQNALRATREIQQIVAPFAHPNSLWNVGDI